MLAASSPKTLPPPPHAPEHWRRVRDEVARAIAEVPLYAGRAQPPHSDAPEAIAAWLASLPTISKRDLRRGFPRALVRQGCDLKAALEKGEVEIVATSGTTSERLQVLWETAWWDPQEREAMRLNARVDAVMREGFREAVLTSPVCSSVCHIGQRTRAERTVDGMLFLNQMPDPTLWTDAELARMVEEWNDLRPHGVEADPRYLAALCRYALEQGRALHAPDFVTLTYEQTTRASLRAVRAALPGTDVCNLYGATEAGVLFMECAAGRLHHNARHSHVELADAGGGLARVIVTTLGRRWMPLVRYEVGDLVRVAEGCSCGRAAEGYVLARIEGRALDVLSTASGPLSPAMIDDLIDGAEPAVVQWQLEPASPGGWLLHVVGSSGERAAAALASALAASVEPRPAAAIPPEASGKYRSVRAA